VHSGTDYIFPLKKHYIGHCPLSVVYLIYMKFRELGLFPYSGEWLSSHFPPPPYCDNSQNQSWDVLNTRVVC
jgi:hypothetical protein